MATIQGVYIALFGRPADPLGLAFFDAETQGGADLTAIGDLAATAEYQARFTGMTDTQIVNSIYQSLFNRDADLAGLTFFVQALQNGTLNINNIAIAIYDGAQGTDATILANKEAAADAFTAAIDTTEEVLAYSGDAAAAAGRAFLAPITDDAATIPTAAETDAAIQAIVDDPSGGVGQTFTLTNAVGEQVVGTAGDDTFNAVVDAGATAGDVGTGNVGDSINGMGGFDTANLLTVDGPGALPAGFTVSNVEVVNITYSDGNDLGALNSSAFGGVQQLWQVDNDGGSDFQNVTIGAGVTAGFRSTGGTTGIVAAATVTAAAGVTSTAVALDGIGHTSTITLAETTANGLSTVSVSGSVGNNGATPPVSTLTLGSTAGDVDTLNLALTTNTTVVIGALDDLNTLNASASTGGLTVALGTPDELASASFGSGADTVTINTGGLAAGTLAINLGGGNDTFNLAGASNVAATTVDVTLGAGNDTVVVTALTNVTAEATFAADLITITDFNADQDVLDLSAIGALGRDILTNTELANISAALTLEAAIDLAASYTTATAYSVFDYAGDAYVLHNVAGAALANGDGLMKLTGFSVEDIDASNFIA